MIVGAFVSGVSNSLAVMLLGRFFFQKKSNQKRERSTKLD
jgi:hypothetical protein